MNKTKKHIRESLKRDLSKVKTLTIALATCILILFVLAGYQLFEKWEFEAIMILPLALLPMLFSNLSKIKKIKANILEKEKHMTL